MKYKNETYLGALTALAGLRETATERERVTIDFIAEAIAEKGDRDLNGEGYVMQYKRQPWRNEWTTSEGTYPTLEAAKNFLAAMSPIERVGLRIAKKYTVTRYKAVRE